MTRAELVERYGEELVATAEKVADEYEEHMRVQCRKEQIETIVEASIGLPETAANALRLLLAHHMVCLDRIAIGFDRVINALDKAGIDTTLVKESFGDPHEETRQVRDSIDRLLGK